LTDNKFSILFAGTGWPLETFLAQIVIKLCERGYHITLSSPTRPSPDFLQQHNLEWLSCPSWNFKFGLGILRILVLSLKTLFYSPKYFFNLIASLKNIPTLKEKLRHLNRILPYLNGKWDLIYFPWNSAAIELIYLFNLPSKTILSCRGSQISVAPYNPKRFSIQQGLRSTFSKTDWVHCVSKAIQEEARTFGLDIKKSTVINPAIDIDRFKIIRQNPIHEKLKIISVGTIYWRKGFDYALSAIKILDDKKVRIFHLFLPQDMLFFE